MKILAVDDDADVGVILALVLEQAGYVDTKVVMSGTMALWEIVQAEEPYECFLLDINMPEMDGITLCARIREIDAYRLTPIIMLTAMTERSFVAAAFQAGATDYATKPFEIMDLTARLHAARQMAALQGALTASRTAVAVETGAPQSSLDQVDLAAPLVLEGVRYLISLQALENYLVQMSRSGAGAAQILAVQIDRIAHIHARTTPAEFAYALTSAADAISASLQAQGHIMAYAGSGAFLVVTETGEADNPLVLEAEIQAQLDDKDMEYDSGAPLDIEVAVGPPIRPSSGDAERARTGFARAISRALTRLDQRAAVQAGRGASQRLHRRL